MIFVARYLKESRDFSEQPKEGEIRRTSSQAIWRVISHAREPSSRLIWIYAIAIGAHYGSFAVLALFLNARFQVTEQTIFYFFMYIGSISVFARVLLLGRAVDWLGEANLSRLGLVLLAAGVLGMPLSRNLGMLAVAVALIPLGTAFTYPCVTALLSRVIAPGERGLYMGMQQTYGGVTRIIAPLFFGWAFDSHRSIVALLLLVRIHPGDDLSWLRAGPVCEAGTFCRAGSCRAGSDRRQERSVER